MMVHPIAVREVQVGQQIQVLPSVDAASRARLDELVIKGPARLTALA
jgi:hypothetical protein